MSQSRWYVITGAPCSGKTTIIQHLAKAGYKVMPEVARMLIDEDVARGKAIEEIRSDEIAFQGRINERNKKTERLLPLDEIIFFDRAIPDSIAYHRLLGIDTKEALELCRENLYRKVFCLELLPFIKDYARIEDAERMFQLHSFLQDAYVQLGYDVILVPVLPPIDRVQFILKHI